MSTRDLSSVGLRADRQAAVLRLTITRPEKLNAVTAELIQCLYEQIAATDARVVVITGEGRAFSSGADLEPGAGGPTDGTSGGGENTLTAANRLLCEITGCDAVVIAAINGPAAGIGCSIALAADLPVMAEEAYLLLPFTNIGLMPDGGVTATWAAAAGRVHAMRAALFGERIPAAEALQTGLVAATAPAAELGELVDRWAQTLADRPRVALARTKQAINASTLGHLPQALSREETEQEALLAGADFTEGVQAFLERRQPHFTD